MQGFESGRDTPVVVLDHLIYGTQAEGGVVDVLEVVLKNTRNMAHSLSIVIGDHQTGPSVQFVRRRTGIRVGTRSFLRVPVRDYTTSSPVGR